ncbi:histidine phosphatase family protein [Umezawaea sp.]|uniref:histidine phosphatase family protein n=1 Tax=Umezawaea sp. TaxID=1955258 RepID=UPI002ED4CF91
MPTEICLVRHAAYDAADGRRSADGRWDPPLSPEGRRQADAVAARLSAFTWDHVRSSHLLRATATAERIAEACGRRPDRDPAWAEFSKGELEGFGPTGVDPEEHARHWRDGDWRAWPGGERRTDFRERVLTALHGCPAGARTVVVTHGGVVNEVLCALLGGPPRALFRLDFSGVTRIGLDRGRAVVAAVNDTWHLEDSLSVPLTVFSSKDVVR